jgi:hypothetical protein
MCGLGGHSGIIHQATRARLTRALALGIDHRGGHACGFVSVSRKKLRHGRNLGEWAEAPGEFHDGASAGSIMTLLHSRFATCGSHTTNNAHPFAIERAGRVALYGAHNGVIDNAHDSAEDHDRAVEVDSQELFELLADNDIEGFRRLSGYGAITWIRADDPALVYLARISYAGDLEAVELHGSGIVWASTSHIIDEALREADLHNQVARRIDLAIGQVYEVAHGRIQISERHGYDRLELSDMWLRESRKSQSRFWSGSMADEDSERSGWGAYTDCETNEEFWARWHEREQAKAQLEREAEAMPETAAELESIDESWDDSETDDDSDDGEPIEDDPNLEGPDLWRYIARQEAKELRERKQWERMKRAIGSRL